MSYPGLNDGDTYECQVCRGVFIKGHPDSEALAEMAETWVETSDPQYVCDDCYALVAAWAQLDHPEYLREQP